LDALKGAVAVVLVAVLFRKFPFPIQPVDDFTLVQIIAGIAALLVHLTVLRFKGGKGIATVRLLITIITLICYLLLRYLLLL
jgi:glycerol-3-phosphate acyltransferase PlsY